LVLRFAAGVASAFVLVGISAWALGALGTQAHAGASGVLFAGVGIGMVVAGLVALAAGVTGQSATTAWALLGALAAAVSVASCRATSPRACCGPRASA